ncbi:MAG: hypothetical protein HDR09_06115 [Lachnospiraceae bacterium]|nr:hypothetical protein [Lachnospiraceae bacterium]
MAKEFDEYIADKPELNLVSKEEVALLKIKLGKSHRKESDWDVIKEIFWKRNVLTFTPTKRAREVTNIEKILCEDGFLVVFSNIDDCTRHIREMQHRGILERYVQIGTIPFVDVLEIADQHNKDVLIDVDEERNSMCFMYAHKSKELKAVILEQP